MSEPFGRMMARRSGRRAMGAVALVLAACGPARAPQDYEKLVDGRGGHAGTFNAAGDGNDDDGTNTITEGGNTQ